MPSIRTLPDLFKLLLWLFLAFLAVKGIISIPGKKGIITMVAPSVANLAYDTIDTITVVIAYIFLFGLVGIVAWTIVCYFRNRKRTKGPSVFIDEDKLKDMSKYINELRQTKTMLDAFFSEIGGKGDTEYGKSEK